MIKLTESQKTLFEYLRGALGATHLMMYQMTGNWFVWF